MNNIFIPELIEKLKEQNIWSIFDRKSDDW